MSEKEKDWKSELSEEAYAVCRLKQTEKAFSGKFVYHHQTGIYACHCCGQALFDSNNKYQSPCGWPTFDAPISIHALVFEADTRDNMYRIEVKCSQCDAHIGHLFADGPKDTTGERYCVNSVALDFLDK